ncbi:MAG: hypothetical protein IMW89_10875 [Ktedonobacteraceae bacterium]|nr:hypothetical protein [Ktedonobacteraceae bacterium]
MERRMLFLMGGVVILVLIVLGIGVFVILPGFISAKSPASATPTATATPLPTAAANPYAIYLKQYGPQIKQQIAQGLHLTPEQLTAQLQEGKSLDDIAKAQHVSPEQLNTLIARAFQSGLKPAVDSGGLTQKQVDALVKRMQKNHQQLGKLLGADGKKKQKAGTPTPPTSVATATAATNQ